MLKRNKIAIGLTFVLTVLLFTACGYEEGEASYFAPYFLDKDNIDSDKIKVVEVIRHELVNGESEERIVTRRGLEGVACSLRSFEVEDGSKILAYAKSYYCGIFSIAFSSNKKDAEKYSGTYYWEDFTKLYEDKKAGKSPFYLIINDPELGGYDEKYETRTLTYNDYDSDNPHYVQLGKNTQE